MKVSVLYVVTLFDWTPIFEWYMTKPVLENGHQNDICYDEIGLCAQYIDTIVGSIVNTLGGLMWPLERESSLWPLLSFAYLLWFWRLKWWSSLFIANANWMRQFLIWPNSQNLSMELESAHNRSMNLLWNLPRGASIYWSGLWGDF